MKSLEFKSIPTLDQLAGLEVNGHPFKVTDPNAYTMFKTTMFHMEIPGTFRFGTNLEIMTHEGNVHLLATRSYSSDWKHHEMSQEDAIHRLNFNDKNKTGDKVQKIVDELLQRGLVEWVENDVD